MSVKTLESYQEFTADGSTTYFTFNFNYVDSSEIVVGMRTGDNQYTVVDPVNYVLTKNASTDGGKIRFVTTKPCENPDDPTCGDYIDNPPPAGAIVRIERKTVRSSTADWYVGLDMNSLVGLFDKLIRITQENTDKFKNTIQTFPTQQGITVRELLSEHDKKIFYWNNEKQWLDITDFTIDDIVRQTDVGNILEQANVYSDEQNAVLESKINGKLTAVESQIDANADAIQKTREDYIQADSEIHQILNSHADELTTLRGNQASLGDQVSGIEEKIPESASGSNPLITKQQLLDEEMDIRSDLIDIQSELQQQLNAQAAAIAGKQDQLTAGDNVVIDSNGVISATVPDVGGFDMVVVDQLPETGEKGILYLVKKDGAAPDVHDEYVWIESTQAFELIGTTQVDLTDYVKNTDYSAFDKAGLVKASTQYGTKVLANGYLTSQTYTLDTYNSKLSGTGFISKDTLENIKYNLVKRAVTENDIALTDDEKTAARTWIGAISNTDYAGTDGSPGTFRPSIAYGTQMVVSGYLRAHADTLEPYKTRGVNFFISKGTLENIKDDYVKRGLTENALTFTDEEKANARTLIGASRVIIRKWS